MRRLTFIVLALSVAAGCRSEAREQQKAEQAPQSYGKLGEFRFTDQAGRPLGSAELKDQTWVAAFMFTRCPTVCPRITQRMRDVQKKLAEASVPARLVSISVDPEHDTPEVLRKYAEQYGADLATWSFVTGDPAAVQRTAVEGFKMALEGTADAQAEHYGIVHGSHLVLVKPGLEIAGYYRTTDDDATARLVKDAKRVSSR